MAAVAGDAAPVVGDVVLAVVPAVVVAVVAAEVPAAVAAVVVVPILPIAIILQRNGKSWLQTNVKLCATSAVNAIVVAVWNLLLGMFVLAPTMTLRRQPQLLPLLLLLNLSVQSLHAVPDLPAALFHFSNLDWHAAVLKAMSTRKYLL
jgi:hypothetical protein